jgi:hypothetical protein
MKVTKILLAALVGRISLVSGMVVNNSVALPTNECGYSNIVYNDSLSTFNSDDTVEFFDFYSKNTDIVSNCGVPVDNATIGCVHLQHMTGPFSMFGYAPYTIWYYPYPINNSYTMNLFYNYNGGSTIMVGAVPCDDQLYMLGLTKCAFNQQLFSYQFYKYYLFNFYVKCSFNGTTMSLKIDETADTCVGFEHTQSSERKRVIEEVTGTIETPKCIVNHDIVTLVDFQDWVPIPFDYVYDTSDFGVYTTSTTPTELPTETVTETVNVTLTETETVNVTLTETGLVNATTTFTVTETGTSNATITETGLGNATITITETGLGNEATVTITETGLGNEATVTITETGLGNEATTITITETETVTNDTSTLVNNDTITTTMF